jgi:hypothetical protein
MLNMAPSNYARQKKWFQEPWVEEVKDPKFGFTYKTLELDKDGNEEVMRAVLENELKLAERVYTSSKNLLSFARVYENSSGVFCNEGGIHHSS